MRRKPGRRMKDMAKRGMVGLLTVSMCLSHVQGIAFADNRVEVGEVEVDGQKITLSLRGDSIMDAAKAAFEDAHLYENEYLGVSKDAKTQAAYRALTDGTNPLYEMDLFSEAELQALEDAGVEVKALIQMDQEQAEAEGNLKPATESNASRADEENTQLVVFDPKKEGKKDLLLYKQDSLFASFYDQFSNQLMNQTATEITEADPASYEINGDEKVTFILINHADDSRVLNLKLNDATLEKGIKLPKAETVIHGVMHTLDAKGIDDTTEKASPSVVPTQEATTADTDASTEATTDAAIDSSEANAETRLPAESETTAAAAETLPQEGQIESENIKSEATEAAPEHKTIVETVKETLAQAVETVKETITAVEETFGVIHSEAAENEGLATESELEKETTAAAAEEKNENTKTEMDTALENERKDLLKNTKASELVDSSVASAKVLQYTLDDLSKAYWSAEIEGEYEVNVFAEKTAFDADDQVKLQLKKLDKPEEAEDGTLATTDDTLSKEQVDALKADGSYENSQSIDIRFVDEDGQEVEPKTPVKVKIKVYKDALPEDADISNMTIKHLDESSGSVQADTVASYGDATNGAIKAVDEQGKKVELKSVDADTAEAEDEGVEAASVAAATTKEVLPEEAVGVESTFTVKSFSSFTFTFANTGDRLTTVETVSNKDLGLHLYMTDFNNTVGDSKCRFGGGEYWDKQGKLTQGIYSSIIQNGEYPTLTEKAYTVRWYDGGTAKTNDLENDSLNGRSIENWCGKKTDGAGNATNEVDHLFLKSRYDKDGYFYYSSADNFATLMDQNTGKTTDTFKVYNQLGTPDSSSNFFYQRGNFMPYNRLKTDDKRNKNLYDYKGNPLPDSDPRKHENLYGFYGENNYYFGMYGYANFYQPEDGKVNGKNMVYKFTGDDDLVVYVDDVLVLDLGGIHEAQSGSIDFTTGKIQYTDYKREGNIIKDTTPIETTIKAQFLAAYNKTYGEEGQRKFDELNSTWQSGTDGTFKYGTKHTIKFFYMERGAGASNLRLEMNIQPIPGGSLTVHKKVDNLNREQAKNETYNFQLLKEDGTPLKNEPYMVGVGNETVTYHTGEDDGKFTLKGDESAVFTKIEEDTKVKVVEQDIDAKYEDPLYVATNKNGVKTENSKDAKTVIIPKKKENKDVLIEVTNTLKNPKSLSITKKFYVDGSEDKATEKINMSAFKDAKFALQEKRGTTYVDLYEITYQNIVEKSGTYTFDKLDPTKTYKVIEKITKTSADNGGTTVIPYKETEYRFGNGNSQNIGSNNPATSDFSLTEAITTLTFINKYESATKDITFTKVDCDHNDTKLSGASFVIAKKGTDDSYTTITENIQNAAGEAVVNSGSIKDGKFVIPEEGSITLKLSPGDYQLTEVKAPDGYNLLTKTVNFTISDGELSVNTDDMYYMNSDENGVIIKNKAGVALPVTGGTGTILFSLGGMALMLIALGYVVMKRREEGVFIK